MKKLFRSHFPARCAVCGVEIAVGSLIRYNCYAVRGKRATCQTCAEKPPERPSTTPATEENIELHFDSPLAMLEYSEQRPKDVGGDNLSTWLARTEKREWFGCGAVANPAIYMHNLFTTGWPDGVVRIHENLTGIELTTAPRSIKRRLTWSDHGDYLDIHRVYTGDCLHAWKHPTRQSRVSVSNITLGYCNVIPAGQDHAALFWRGAAIVKLCDLLTTAGYNVEIVGMMQERYALQSRHRYGTQITNLTHIKQFTQPLDIQALAATVAHPGAARVVLYRALIVKASECGIAHGAGLTSAHQKIAGILPNALLADGRVCNQQTAQAWVDQQIIELDTKNLAAV